MHSGFGADPRTNRSVSQSWYLDPVMELGHPFVFGQAKWPAAGLPSSPSHLCVRRHRQMLRFTHVVIAAAGLSSHVAHADALPASARTEVLTLLQTLGQSGCQFNRNGSWYPAAEARSHLLRKLEYVEKHSSILTTEKFIEVAASASSSSGKPYQVRCGNAAPVPSSSWLSQQLQAIRAPAAAASK